MVTEYLKDEQALGRIIGPLDPLLAEKVHSSPFGVIPKQHSPGNWRLIIDLSSPQGASVNDGINPKWCSLTYISVDSVTKIVAGLGRGTMLGKMDIKSAYRIIPVRPVDRLLLGMSWQGSVFVDTKLPFGLRSAPLIFTAIADALEWIVKLQGVKYLFHYLDDFITCGSPGITECATNMQKLIDCCSELGIPISTEKTEGPAICITFLGIEMDTQAMELRLPARKLTKVRQTVLEWLDRKAAKRRELESLIGILQHATKRKALCKKADSGDVISQAQRSLC